MGVGSSAGRALLRIGLAIATVVVVTGVAVADVSVTFTTTPAGGPYDPNNIVAVWIENQAGTFVKTIGRYAGVRKNHLVAWIAKAGPTDVDAVSGATRNDHVAPLTMTWNLRDKLGALVPDGTYTIRMELADSNANQPDQNNQGTFTFVKSDAPETQTGLSNGGFVNASIDFQPVVDLCNNGAVDPDETCDPSVPDSCPTTCEASVDACAPNVIVGAAATCNAACVVQPITACTNDDGCCAEGCDATSDNDCDAELGGNGAAEFGSPVTGGCSTNSGGGLLALLAILLAGAVLVGRSRRSVS